MKTSVILIVQFILIKKNFGNEEPILQKLIPPCSEFRNLTINIIQQILKKAQNVNIHHIFMKALTKLQGSYSQAGIQLKNYTLTHFR